MQKFNNTICFGSRHCFKDGQGKLLASCDWTCNPSHTWTRVHGVGYRMGYRMISIRIRYNRMLQWVTVIVVVNGAHKMHQSFCHFGFRSAINCCNIDLTENWFPKTIKFKAQSHSANSALPFREGFQSQLNLNYNPTPPMKLWHYEMGSKANKIYRTIPTEPIKLCLYERGFKANKSDCATNTHTVTH